MLTLSVLWGPLLRFLFPRGFHRTCDMSVTMTSGGTTQPYTTHQQAEINRKMVEKKKEEKKRKEEEEVKKKLEEEKEKMEKETKKKEEELEEELEVKEKEEVGGGGGGGGLVRRRAQPEGEEVAESSHAVKLRLQQVEDLDWVEKFGYETELIEEHDDMGSFYSEVGSNMDQEVRKLIEEKKWELN
ncbi:hypothetical protein CBR_g24087 [Chara braunii]|uniref:Uncharacterized protein n=1 Tax=Chara braunii TaxID=69332 RepID=A0A388L5Q5_CHABU|nr:hypothetical protein CBR_g24087 [Chara braunii]|eukprot:GBG77641.1 hypothetical protein CBR_g24087 [Chara braunii]